MKKILSLTLAALMVVSMIPTAFAAENEADYTAGTQITLNGSGTEQYTVTVPAKMVPGDTGTVKAEGMWNSDKFLNVGAPSSVTLTYGAQTMDVAITGGKFSLIGNSAEAVSKEVEIAVEDASRLFGTWEGVLEYDVALIQKGDVNQDGIIDQADVDMIGDAAVQSVTLSEDQKKYADINGDGYVDSIDMGQANLIIKGNYSKAAINGTAATE